jgi:DNA replication protein DnaC
MREQEMVTGRSPRMGGQEALVPVQTPLEREIRTLEADRNTTPRGSSELKEPKCAVCSDTYWEPVEGTNRVKRCECQKKRIMLARIRVVLEDWKEYKDARLQTFMPLSGNIRQANALNAIRENPHGSYFLTGYYRQGKTRLLVAQYRYLAEYGERCLLRTARDLMEELRRAEAPTEPGKPQFESAVLQMVNQAETGHLFVDDIEKAPARSDFRAESLFGLLDTMKRREIRLTYTSNLPLISRNGDDLRAKLTDQVVSRLDKLCQPIDLGGGKVK